MPSFLQIENISKSYGPKVLFDHIGFNINEGDKIALIAPNGTGKTSLLRILAGKDSSDSGGSVKFLRHIRIAFLEQEYAYDPDSTVFDAVWNSSRHFLEETDEEGVFEYEIRIRRILSELGLKEGQRMRELSGGEVKRVAITGMLSSNADFLIMDEPTNHLDIEAIEYLENTLRRSRCTLFMVTHDRYFLDRVCNTVMEMDHGSVYIYKGDYENYLEKREERIASYNAETDKVRNILRRELEWMHASPCARTGKAKYRKQAFWNLKERAEEVYRTETVSMESVGSASRLGTKIINCSHASFNFGERAILKDFTYNFQRFEKVGIVGRNGVGKSTFIKLLLGELQPCGGTVERGESLNIGYYSQTGMSFDEDQTVLETVPDTRLLSQFLFPHDMYSNRASTLSGGEKRRLYLLTVLQKSPNLLILDEPTNDLDIVTLNVLEEYLSEFKGSTVIVTHDRHFLDRLADHLLVFCGDGLVKDFIGGYTEYRTFIRDYEEQKKKEAAAASAAAKKAAPQSGNSRPPATAKLTYKEKRELEALEEEMVLLEGEKSELEKILSSGGAYDEVRRASERYESLKEELDAAEMRWLELSEKN